MLSTKLPTTQVRLNVRLDKSTVACRVEALQTDWEAMSCSLTTQTDTPLTHTAPYPNSHDEWQMGGPRRGGCHHSNKDFRKEWKKEEGKLGTGVLPGLHTLTTHTPFTSCSSLPQKDIWKTSSKNWECVLMYFLFKHEPTITAEYFDAKVCYTYKILRNLCQTLQIFWQKGESLF